MEKKNNEAEDYAIYTGKVAEVIWNEDGGKLLLETEGKLIEFPIEHYNTVKDFELYTGRNVKLLVENGKITGLKPV